MYGWVEIIHIVAVISWMSGMLYLPRLFVYHSDVPIKSDTSETFKIMERRLLRYIMNPAMIIVVTAGLYLMWQGDYYLDGWMHTKLLFVVLMLFMHGLFARYYKNFAKDKNNKKPKFFRIINEIPTLLLIFIVILVVMKPF